MSADLEYLRLSLRKDRKTLIALPAMLAVTLALTLFKLRRGTGAAADAAQGVLTFWAVIGLPILSVVLAGHAGEQSHADAGVESALPLSPGRRALGRLAVVFLTVAAFAAVIYAARVAVLSWDTRLPAPGLITKCALCAMYGALCAFAVAYATESSVIGAMLGLLTEVAMALFFGPLVVMELLYPGRGEFWSTFWGITLAGAAAAAFSVGVTARQRVWRRVSGGAHAAAQLAIAAFLALAVLGFSDCYISGFWRGLQLFHGFVGTLRLSQPGAKFPLEVRLKALSGGVYLNALDGRLLWLGEDGTTTQVAPPRSTRGLLNALANIPNAAGGDLYYASDGLVWLLRPNGAGGAEVWRGQAGKPMSLVTTLPREDFVDALVEGPAGMELLSEYPKHKLAALTPERPLQWRELPWPRSWYWRSGQFGAAQPDGSSAILWFTREAHRRGVGLIKTRAADGSLKELGVAPVPVEYAWSVGILARLDVDRAWYVEGRRLVERDLRGRLLGSWALPAYRQPEGEWPRTAPFYHATAEGLYLRTRFGLTLVDWQGRVVRRYSL